MCMPRELLSWFKLEAAVAVFCARHLMPFLCVVAALSVAAELGPSGGSVLLAPASEPGLLSLSRARLSCAWL